MKHLGFFDSLVSLFKQEKNMDENRIQIDMDSFISTSKKYFNKEDIVNIMEIGSLDGNDSLFFKSEYPNANVYCIEGLPENYNEFLKDLKNITTINAVIADYDGTIDFHKKNINGIHGIFDRGSQYGIEKLKLKCYTMKTICKMYNISSLDLVKIDVEGATYEILKSMDDIIDTIKIMHIETEMHEFFKNQKL